MYPGGPISRRSSVQVFMLRDPGSYADRESGG
jgi:hypothetical protein